MYSVHKSENVLPQPQSNRRGKLVTRKCLRKSREKDVMVAVGRGFGINLGTHP